jgi:hypothetical protein
MTITTEHLGIRRRNMTKKSESDENTTRRSESEGGKLARSAEMLGNMMVRKGEGDRLRK